MLGRADARRRGAARVHAAALHAVEMPAGHPPVRAGRPRRVRRGLRPAARVRRPGALRPGVGVQRHSLLRRAALRPGTRGRRHGVRRVRSGRQLRPRRVRGSEALHERAGADAADGRRHPAPHDERVGPGMRRVRGGCASGRRDDGRRVAGRVGGRRRARRAARARTALVASLTELAITARSRRASRATARTPRARWGGRPQGWGRARSSCRAAPPARAPPRGR